MDELLLDQFFEPFEPFFQGLCLLLLLLESFILIDDV
jgi:hypothetical protein